MSKDPAFLFYYQDFAYGTRKMSFEEKGCYIELLCEQADIGHLSLEDIKRALKLSFPIWETICCKFAKDDNGLFYNIVLQEHIQKRKSYTESRLNNLHMGRHKVFHMENVNENKNVIKDKENKLVFNFEEIWAKYPKRIGKKEAERHFKASIKTENDYEDIKKALVNYLKSERVYNNFIQNGSTWFNNWRDWVEHKELVCEKCKNKGEYTSSTGYKIVCDCKK